jgi:hypothetical protein
MVRIAYMPRKGKSIRRLRSAEALAEREWLKKFLEKFNEIRQLAASEQRPHYFTVRALYRLTQIPNVTSLRGIPEEGQGRTLGVVVPEWCKSVDLGLFALAFGRYAVFPGIRVVNPDGSESTNEGGMFNGLVDHLIRALQAVGVNRLKICQICQKLFLAPRSRSTRCSRRCENVANQRAHYQRKQKRERKRLAEALRLLPKKRELKEIADDLGVSVKRAQGYVLRAKAMTNET